MSSLIAGRVKIVGKSFQSGNAIANWKKIIAAMRKLLDVSGVERHVNNFQDAQLQARKKISAMVKIARGYLGNQLFFCHAARLSSAKRCRRRRSMPGN
jgi:hypothetical protein